MDVMASALAWLDAHEGAAAWVQGFFSVVAIVAAAWIAHGEARERRAREAAEDQRAAAQQRALVSSAFAMISEARRVVADEMQVRVTVNTGWKSDLRLAEVAQALAEFPTHTIDNSRVVQMLMLTRTTVASIRSVASGPIWPHLDNVRQLSDQLGRIEKEVLEIITKGETAPHQNTGSRFT